MRKISEENYWLKMLIIAAVDAVLAGFYLRIFPLDYTINLAVAILPIYYYFDHKLNPIKTSFWIASIGLLFRTITGVYFFGSFKLAFLADFPFLYFDLMYGLIFYFVFFKNSEKNIYRLFVAALLADFLGNAIEFTMRFGLEVYLTGNVMATLLVVALVRAIITTVLICALFYYRSFLRREEHNERYRMQVKMISDLRGEIYFLKNNMEKVEQVMDEAFGLYRSFDSLSEFERKQMALNIAKNVHEVKKNYFRTVEGIDVAITPGGQDLMTLCDLMKFLEQSLSNSIDLKSKKITITTSCKGLYWIKSHALLMSVLNNLMTNSIEAISQRGFVSLIHELDRDNHIFIVKDNGKGISEEDLPYLYTPGYSTKYDETSGNVNRGVGLSLVKDIVTGYFEGEIYVDSIIDVGTAFKIVLPRHHLEEQR